MSLVEDTQKEVDALEHIEQIVISELRLNVQQAINEFSQFVKDATLMLSEGSKASQQTTPSQTHQIRAAS